MEDIYKLLKPNNYEKIFFDFAKKYFNRDTVSGQEEIVRATKVSDN